MASSIPLHHTSSSSSLYLHHVDKSIEYYELASKQGIALMKKKKKKEPGKQEGRGKGSGGWMSSIGGAIVRDLTHSRVH
jgi:hypothetical protein